ncbi:HAD-like protein [Atractiella rhizophila]|nr:HAD-like protein [Atractiella rhizophila]
MGTVTDWHSHISSTLTSSSVLPSTVSPSSFALRWREGFFTLAHSIAADPTVGSLDDIDDMHTRALEVVLREEGVDLSEEMKKELVRAWHGQKGWEGSADGLERIRKGGYIVAVLANGSTRYQIDVVRPGELEFDMLFSSQLLQSVKPRKEMYLRALELLNVKPEEATMVAAHAYDLDAAKSVGMSTVYIERETEDVGLLREEIREKVNMFVEGGLVALAELLNC